MSHKIKYKSIIEGIETDVAITDAELIGGTIDESNAMVAETLVVDSLDADFIVPDEFLGGQLCDVNGIPLFDSASIPLEIEAVDITKFVYGSDVLYFRDEALIGKFYARQIRQTGKKKISLEAISAIGLLANRKHKGGLYEMETVGDIISDIMGDIPYTISDDVASCTVSGWLPYDSARNNLQSVLFSVGASITKDAQKNIQISFLSESALVQIADKDIYEGGSINYQQTITDIYVTEHGFYNLPTDTDTVLFDNTDGSGSVDHALIIFDAPYHDLTASGITLHESGVNYAVISGIGTLEGKEYTHTTKEIHKPTSEYGESNARSVSNCYLISLTNSQNTAERVANYYKRISEVNMSVVANPNIKPGKKVSFTDPFGRSAEGYVKSAERVMSGIDKLNLSIATDWTPGHFGSNYNNYALLTGSGTWTVPAGVTRIRINLVGGGASGQAGQNGGNGQSGSVKEGETLPDFGENGKGGKGGEGGHGGKILSTDITVTPGQVFSFACGAGGANGDGTDTTFGSYSSASGALSAFGVVNPFTGDAYGQNGENGTDGADGGGSVGDYIAGATGASTEFRYGGNAHYAYGGIGGGAAIGGGGANGNNGYFGAVSLIAYGGDGGNGADAEDTSTVPANYGQGGHGGHGGGGGGGGGAVQWTNTRPSLTMTGGSGGIGGAGGAGGSGANGCGLILY